MELPHFLKVVKDISLFHMYNIMYGKYYKSSATVMHRFRNSYHGKRCFIVATGPSIKGTDLSLLDNEIVFGVNTLYKTGIKCDFYAVSDPYVWREHHEQILQQDTILILASEAGRDYIRHKSKYDAIAKHPPIVLRTKGYMTVTDEFSTDASKYVVNGHTVINDICLQVAYYMGFDRVYLIGTDYSNLGTHWDGSKAENTKALGLRDTNRVFYAFDICRRAYEKDGREIVNATKGGKLEVFKRENLEDVI